MGYRAWARAGTALLLAMAPPFYAVAQNAAPTSPTLALATAVPVLTPAAQASLQKAIAGNQRIEPSRDRARNPAATLQFFGVRPTDTVIEVWPGQGWYTSILGPYLKQGSGSLIVGHFDASSTNSSVVRQIVDAYRARFAADQGTYGSVSVVPFGPRSGPLGAPNSADSVLTFRNIHNWMAQGWAEKAFGDFYLVLKPGGILGIEEHRGRTDEPQDPLARDGYVREDFVIQLAREAGFEFIGRSEINANPADTKDHPFGVWTLPPVSRTSPLGQRDDPGFDRTRYDAIGESDRMTLRFRKPLNASAAPPAPGTRWSPVIVAPAPPAPPRSVVPPPPPIVRPPIVRPNPVVPSIVPPTVPAIAPPRPPVPTSPPALTPIIRPPSGPPISATAGSNSEASPPRAVDPAPRVPSRPVSPPPTPAPPTPVQATLVPPTPVPSVVSPPPSPPPVAPLPPAPPPPAVVQTTLPPILPSPPAVTPPAVTPPVLPPPVAPPPVSPPPAVVPITPPAATQPVLSPPIAPPALAPSPPIVAPAKAPPSPPVAPVRAPPAPRPSLLPKPPLPKPPPPAAPRSPPPAATSRPVAATRPASPPPAARPVTTRPAAARAPTLVPKAKAPPSPPPRPLPRPAPPPIPKRKAAPPPPPDPSKPDWVVPRRRS